jgi:hypothetical protein
LGKKGSLKAGWNSNNNLQVLHDDDIMYYKNKKSNNSFIGEASKFINEKNSDDKNES